MKKSKIGDYISESNRYRLSAAVMYTIVSNDEA